MQWTVRFAVSSSCFFSLSKPVNPVLLDDKFFNQLEDDVSQIVQRDKHREQYSNSAGHEVNNSSEQVRKLTRSLIISARDKKKYLTKVQNLYKSVVPQCRMQLSVTPQLLILFSFLKLPGCENWAVKIWCGKERPGNYEAEKDNFTMGGKMMWWGEIDSYESSKEHLHMQ